MRRIALLAALLTFAAGRFPLPLAAEPKSWLQESKPLPSIGEKATEMEKWDGFIPLYWDAKTGQIWMEIGRFDQELLYYVSLPAGMGQNDLNLNRGDLGPSMVVTFHRVGPKILLYEPNYSFRAESDDPQERKSVEDGFPASVIWGFEVGAATGEDVLVDATSFFIRDAHGVINTLRVLQQGTYKLDSSRSAIYLPGPETSPKTLKLS